MCDEESRARFLVIEHQLVQVATDVKWIKKLIGVLLLILAASFGVDLTGVVE